MSPRVILITVIGLLAGGVAALSVISRPPADVPQKTVNEGKALIGGPFSLTSTAGEAVTDQTYRGKPMLVYFGFTNCPDICPSGLQIISAALDKLGPDASKISPLFITLDPDRDTAAKLGEYLQSFHPRLVGLTGSPDATAIAAKAYRVYAKKVPTGTTPAEYTVDHTGFMYLMDANGTFVTHFPHNVSAEKLAVALAEAIAKS
jgi:protein SCO1